MKIFDAHRTGIESAQQCVRDRMLDFAEELLLTFWPQVRGKSVGLKELVSMGLPSDQPDDDVFDEYLQSSRRRMKENYGFSDDILDKLLGIRSRPEK